MNNSHFFASKKIIMWYSLAFILFGMCYFGTILATGHTLIWSADAARQHLPILMQFHHDVWTWLNHFGAALPLWTWHMGLGNDILSVYSYYVIGDIFSYPTLLVPASLVPTAFCVMIVVRLYCAGLAMIVLSQRLKLSPVATVATAITYISSGYIFYAVIAQPFFINALVIFPLLLWATVRYLEEKKLGWLGVMLWWCFVNNFYFAYMMGIGYGIFWCLYLIKHLHQYKRVLSDFVRVVSCTIVAAMVASIVLLPAIMGIKTSVRSTDSVFANGMSLYPYSYYLTLPGRMVAAAGTSFWASLWFVVPVVLGIICVILRTKKYPIISGAIILTFIALLLPQAAAIFNGFSSPYNRWLMLAFVPFALAVGIMIDELKTVTKKELLVQACAVGSYLVVIAVILRFNFIAKNKLAICFAVMLLIAAWLVVLGGVVFKKTRLAAVVLALFTLVNACYNGYWSVAPNHGNFAASELVFGDYKNNTTNAFGGIDNQLANPQSYRINAAGMFLGAGGQGIINPLSSRLQLATSFYSVIGRASGDFSKAIGNNDYSPIEPIGKLDMRTISENFLGVKYLFAMKGKYNPKTIPYGYHKFMTKNVVRGTHKYQMVVYKTTNNLPLMWWSNHYALPSTTEQLSLSQREAMLLQAVEVPQTIQTTGLTKVSASSSSAKQLKIQIVDKNGKKISVNTIVYNVLRKNNDYRIKILQSSKYRHQELHVELTNIKTKAANANQLVNAEMKASTSSHHLTTRLKSVINASQQMPAFAVTVTGGRQKNSFRQRAGSVLPSFMIGRQTVLNMGTYATKLPKKLGVKFSGNGTVTATVKVYAVNLGNNYQKAVKTIQQNALTNVKKTTNQVTANYNHQKVGIVTTTIPYSTGWSAYVDGKKVAVIETNYGFVGFNAPAGKHSVKLVYTTPGLKLGAILSVLGILGVALIAVWKRQKSYFRKNLDKIK